MPPTPVDDHTEEYEQLAGLSALDVLEGDELARFERHAASCARCRLMVRLDREALARAAQLDMKDVPRPEPGFLYEAWVIPRDGQAVPAGTTTSGNATLPLPRDVRGTTVAITKERTRVEAPTSAPILATQVQL